MTATIRNYQIFRTIYIPNVLFSMDYLKSMQYEIVSLKSINLEFFCFNKNIYLNITTGIREGFKNYIYFYPDN